MKDPDSGKVFLRAQIRIRSMAGLYEHLYRSEGEGRIDLKTYILDFVEFFSEIYAVDTKRIRFDVTLEIIKLDVKRAVPVVLILNELMTNSVKHAFPGNGRGKIFVNLAALKGILILSVSDDGVGLPEEFDLRPPAATGFELIHTLAKRIGGTLETKQARGRGMMTVLRFDL